MSSSDPAPTSENETEFSCAICYEDLSTDNIARLPCCYSETSSIKYCKDCMNIVCQRSRGLGRCPTCSEYIRSLPTPNAEGNSFIIADNVANCFCCAQLRVIADETRKLCDACVLGRHYAFRYECEGCGTFQIIRHPMWRYQETPASFSNDTWFCSHVCRDQKRWYCICNNLTYNKYSIIYWSCKYKCTARRIHANDLSYVPIDDRPESWGQQEEWFAAIREQRIREQRLRQRARNAPAGFGFSRWIALGVLFLLIWAIGE